MIELDNWILAVNVEEHEKMVGSIERVMVDRGAAVSVCPLGYAPEIPMTNHLRRATLRTATGAQIEHAGQKTVEYENSDGGSVKVSFEVADVTRPLVAVGELQKRGMTVVMGPHGSFVTRGHVTKPPGSNLDLEHSNGAYWLCLTRGENGTSTVAPVDLGDAVPTSENLSDLPTVEGHDRRCKGGRRSERAIGSAVSEGTWSCRTSQAQVDAHAVGASAASQVEERTTLIASQTATQDLQEWNARFHVSVEPAASREPQADHLQHDGQGKPVNGCSSHCEGCK